MGKKIDLPKEEKSQIVKNLNKMESMDGVGKKLQCDHQTIKRNVQNSQDWRKRRVENTGQTLSTQEPFVKRPLATSKAIFEAEVLDVLRSILNVGC